AALAQRRRWIGYLGLSEHARRDDDRCVIGAELARLRQRRRGTRGDAQSQHDQVSSGSGKTPGCRQRPHARAYRIAFCALATPGQLRAPWVLTPAVCDRANATPNSRPVANRRMTVPLAGGLTARRA